MPALEPAELFLESPTPAKKLTMTPLAPPDRPTTQLDHSAAVWVANPDRSFVSALESLQFLAPTAPNAQAPPDRGVMIPLCASQLPTH